MISIVDTQNGNIEVGSGQLPVVFAIPEGGTAMFFKVGGQLTINGVLRYRAVNRVIVDNKPGIYYTPTGTVITFDAANDRTVVTVQYPGSPNVPVPTAADVFSGAFPSSDRAAQMIFMGFLELARRVGALDGQSPANLTANQLITWFQNKVPPAS